MISEGFSIDRVGHRFGATRALHDVTMQVQPGTIHALIGENGAGKSTLVKILSGVLSPTAGSLALGGQCYEPTGPSEARDAGVATVHQELSLANHLSVAESLFLGREPTRFGWLDRRKMALEAQKALARLHRDDISLSARILDLPLADRQIIEIARALHTEARVLILDEPTSSLTGEDAANHFLTLRRLRDEGMAILYISHFLEEVLDLTDLYTVLRDGEVAGHGVTGDVDAASLAAQMVGRPLQERQQRRSPESRSPESRSPEVGEILLDIADLRGTPMPVGTNLQLRQGEILGIGGLVGSGRSELVRSIFGLRAITGGSIRVLDTQQPTTPTACLDAGLGLLSEDRAAEGLALGLSITDNVVMSRWPCRRPGWLDQDAAQGSARRWIEELNIRCESALASVGLLSGGNQQKVALARLLHHDVDVLLLDEPTRGIDIASKDAIYGCIEALSDAGKAILVTSSHLPELLGLCDRVAIMHRGHLGPFLPVAERTEHEMILEATTGVAAVQDRGSPPVAPVDAGQSPSGDPASGVPA